MSASLPPAALQSQVRLMVSLWFRFSLDYDPVPTLQKTMCPVLALNGEKDLQVAPKENLAKVQKALQDGGNKDFQTAELPGLNHLFQHSPTGSPTEYGSILETMAPEALNALRLGNGELPYFDCDARRARMREYAVRLWRQCALPNRTHSEPPGPWSRECCRIRWASPSAMLEEVVQAGNSAV